MQSNKPSSLVVLAGWLGCKQKHLKPYERFYNSLGFDALSVIAPPFCIIDSTVSQQNSSEEEFHHDVFQQSPRSINSFLDELSTNSDTKMQALAWRVIRDIYFSQAEVFIYHSFSNGGCFLWESICKILLLKDKKYCNRETSLVLERIHSKCKGVIFDSCPAWFGTNQDRSSMLWQALQYCSKEERQRIDSIYGARIRTVDKNMLNRNLEYFENLAAFPIDIPQLYLYSKNDALCKQEYISMMIGVRSSRQKSHVFKKVWENSIHCSHLRKHSEDYKEAVKAFIQQLDFFVQARL